MTTHEVLVRARAEIELGWCRKAIVDHVGNVCPRGAIDVVLGAPRTFYRQFVVYDDHPAVEVLRSLVAPESIEGFNDSHTKADALALFDRAVAATVLVGDQAHDFATAA